MTAKPRFVVYASSLGNSFFEEIRDLLACGLRDLGLDAAVADETKGFARDMDWHMVVAPHEFFLMGAGVRLRKGPLPANLVFYGAEQPGSRFYSLALQLFPRARVVWHLDSRAAALLAGRGLECRHVPLGYSAAFPLFKRSPELAWQDRGVFLDPALRPRQGSWALKDRPIDVFFAGSLTDRRRGFFSRAAASLSRHRASIHLADERNLIRDGAPGILDGRMMAGLEQRSKIVLNIHSSQALFFEWHRVAVHGLGQRALMVTEPMNPAPPLKAGRDFIEATMGDIPRSLDFYLGSGRGMRRAQEIADQGFETFSKSCRMADFLQPAVEALLSSGARRKRLEPRPPLEDHAPERRVSIRPPDPGEADVLVKPGRHGAAPKVTVAVSLFNYRRYLAECLDSVARQTLAGLDLIVVDDSSTDGSAAAARRWLGRHGRRFRRWTLTRRKVNAGLSAARNEAFSLSRTAYVFVLDADNSILPPCLERLSRALDATKADFAYSYLSRFGEEEGLSNVRVWDPALLKTRAYLDAMALVRKEAWEKVGGFDTALKKGWEDYDFWLRVARKRGWGVLVPEVLGRYRVHLASMVHRDSEPQAEVLKRLFNREHGVKIDEGRVPQDLVAVNLFGNGWLPIRVGSPEEARGGARQGKYLVAALSILRDLNRDVLP
ncbi:MAG: glycosyltransferase family 2 protein [Elusimicrobia bacterium]|nr:glycosyltransferase family 2 protein [Elusimicrobiota bacterium]